MDVGGRFAGTLSGSMNMMGNFGGMAGPVVVGLILQSHESQLGDHVLALLRHLLPGRPVLADHRPCDAAGDAKRSKEPSLREPVPA